MNSEFAVHGTVAPGFEAVRDAFRANFTGRGELGAACALYHRGEPVVDLLGVEAVGSGHQPVAAAGLPLDVVAPRAQRFHVLPDLRPAHAEVLVPATAENKTLAQKYMAGIVAHGQTEHQMALLAALRNKPEVIYVFTDGGEPGLNQPQLRLITQRADRKTVIHCVQFGFGPLDGVSMLCF